MVQRIAEFTARCEKYVGTESGGMDQAISIMGDKGLAKLVHFKPVRLQSTYCNCSLFLHCASGAVSASRACHLQGLNLMALN